MLWHLEEAQRMPERSGIDDDGPVLFTFKSVVDGKQRCHFRHAGKSGVEQRFDLFAPEDGPTLEDGKDRFAIAVEESFELALRVDLPYPEPFPGGKGDGARGIAESSLKDVGKR